MKPIPCVLCHEPLPAQFGGEYSDATGVGLIARIYCCPTCIKRHGARKAYQRVQQIFLSLQREATP